MKCYNGGIIDSFYLFLQTDMHRSNFYTVWMEKLFVSRDNVLEDGNLAQGRERS